MNSHEVLRRVAEKALFHEEELSEDEWALATRASEKVIEELRLAEGGRTQELHGATPAEIARSILSFRQEKRYECPPCKARGILE